MDKRYVHHTMFATFQRKAADFLHDRHATFVKSSHYLVHFFEARKMAAKMQRLQLQAAREEAEANKPSCLPCCGSKGATAKAKAAAAKGKPGAGKYAPATQARARKHKRGIASQARSTNNMEISVNLSKSLSEYASSQSSRSQISQVLSLTGNLDPDHVADPAARERKYYNAGW
jgi:hypothetical protein